MQSGLLLQIADDGEQIFRLRIAARAEHADQAVGPRAGRLGDLFSANPRYALSEQPDAAAREGAAGGPKADKARAFKPLLLQKDKREYA